MLSIKKRYGKNAILHGPAMRKEQPGVTGTGRLEGIKKIDEYLCILEMNNGISIPFDDILSMSNSEDRRLTTL